MSSQHLSQPFNEEYEYLEEGEEYEEEPYEYE
jgi:hypothetical protein